MTNAALLDSRDVHNDRSTARLIERGISFLLVAALLVCVLAILKPFAAAILFGATLAIASWPLRQWLIHRRFGPRSAAALLLLLSLVAIVLPILLMAPVLADEDGGFMDIVHHYFATTSQRPEWLERVPLVGSKLVSIWDQLMRAGGELAQRCLPHAATLQQMLVASAKALADSVVQILLSLIVATMFWISGSAMVRELEEEIVRPTGRGDGA